MVLGAALLWLAAAAPASPVGMYETRQMEVAAGLELKANGRFRYALSYGAVDEEGEGDWTFDGNTVRLTSNPMPKRPSFELVRDDPAPAGELSLELEDPGFQWGHPLEALARSDSAGTFEISADESGNVDLAGKPNVRSVAPEMPVYGPTGDVFDLSRERGHRLLFRFHANDLGRVPFDHEPLERSGGALLLRRYDTLFRFVKVRP
jgi:hypothetical protein